MHTYILVLEIDRMKVGFPYKPTFHCTVVHWFKTNLPKDKIVSTVSTVFAKTRPIVIKSGSVELFGDNNDLPVHVVDKTHELRRLHTLLVNALERVGIEHLNPEYTKEGWRPHVTNQNGDELAEGTKIKARAAYLIEAVGSLESGPYNVLSRIEFGDEKTA